MPLDQAANLVAESLTSAVDSSTTTLAVSDASAYPDPANGEYNVVVWDPNNYEAPADDPDAEIVRVTGRDTGADTLTVTRGTEGTTAASHPTGARVPVALTAKMIDDIEAGLNAASGGGGSGDIATVTVASSGSSFSADYNCDGTDDHTTINNAISDLPATGGSVVLTEGTYNLGGSITDQGKSGVVVEGQGYATHLRLDGGTQANVFDIDSSDRWTWRNLRIDGNVANQTDGGNRNNQCGIHVVDGSFTKIDSCAIQNTQYNGVRIRSTGPDLEQHIIENSWIHNAVGGSDNLGDGHSITSRNGGTHKRAVCADNIITECGHQSVEWVTVQRATLTGNVIYSTKAESVSSGSMVAMNIHTSADGETSNCTIADNYCAVLNADGTQIHGRGPSMTITGNVCVGGSSSCSGIKLNERSNVPFNGGLIANNHVVDSGLGIEVGAVENVVVSGNYIENCTGDHIFMDSSSSGLVIGNQSVNSGSNGINVAGSNSLVGLNRTVGSTAAGISAGSDNTVAWNLTDDNSGIGPNAIASGSVTLSSGSATVDTGVVTSEAATFQLALGPSTTDADVAGDIRADSGSGNYVIDIEETDTSVGNPTVEYDIVRVR